MEIITTEVIRLNREEHNCLQEARGILSAMHRKCAEDGEIESLALSAIESIDELYNFVLGVG